MSQSHQSKYGLSGRLHARAGKGEELAGILLQAAALVSTAKGCHVYLVSHDATNHDCICIYEVWDSKDDHDNSLQVEGCRELIMQAMPLLAGQPEKGIELKVMGGAGANWK